jgi:hypothetical protein
MGVLFSSIQLSILQPTCPFTSKQTGMIEDIGLSSDNVSERQRRWKEEDLRYASCLAVVDYAAMANSKYCKHSCICNL